MWTFLLNIAIGVSIIIVYGLESRAHGETRTFYFDVWIALLSTLAGMVNVVTLLPIFHGQQRTLLLEILRNLFCPSDEERNGDNTPLPVKRRTKRPFRR